MPNNKRHTQKQMQGTMGKVHPSSRRAGQLDRITLRKSKLSKANKTRDRIKTSQLERPLFFQATLPPPPFTAHTLPALHAFISDVYLARLDDELAAERTARRAGRNKSKREEEIEEQIRRERVEYEAGLEVPDLTHAPTVALLRTWSAKDASFLPLLRYVRLSSRDPELVVVAKRGLGYGVDDGGKAAGTEGKGDQGDEEDEDDEMEDEPTAAASS